MNVIQEAMAAGRPTFGVWADAPSQGSVEVLGRSGIDWVLLDMQHGGVEEHNLLPLIQAAELGGAGALVRVGWTDPRLIMRVLDLGAIGVVVPMVSTRAQATIAAQAVRYPPLGNRSFGPLRRFYDPGSGDAPHTCIVMIETVEALDNVDDIVATPGVDGVLVGPVDLAFALGLGLDVTGSHPTLLEATDKVIHACKRHGKIPCGVAMNAGNAELLLEHGMRLVTIGSDAGYIARGIAEDVKRAKGWATANTR
jgi:4-hydroxy-2-oxoheptanedioate aldolase